MAEIEKFPEIVKQLLLEYSQCSSLSENVEMETIFDEVQNHYQLVALGWQGKKRVYGCLIHIDIKQNKIWLQHNSTDVEVVDRLVKMGIPTDYIVLGFQPEHYRKYTAYAVN